MTITLTFTITENPPGSGIITIDGQSLSQGELVMPEILTVANIIHAASVHSTSMKIVHESVESQQLQEILTNADLRKAAAEEIHQRYLTASPDEQEKLMRLYVFLAKDIS